jgi:rhodanese-related sulfurtransferase
MGSESDAENWIALLDKLIDRRSEYEYVIPGHGGVILNVEALKEQRDYLKDICNEVNNARHRNLSLEKAKKEIRLEKYKKYIYYDRIGLDIEACWKQIEKKETERYKKGVNCSELSRIDSKIVVSIRPKSADKRMGDYYETVYRIHRFNSFTYDYYQQLHESTR